MIRRLGSQSLHYPCVTVRDESGPRYEPATPRQVRGIIFLTGCIVRSVQIVPSRGRWGRGGRVGTHRAPTSLGWGPSGRWFKSSRPYYSEARLGSGFPAFGSLRRAVLERFVVPATAAARGTMQRPHMTRRAELALRAADGPVKITLGQIGGGTVGSATDGGEMLRGRSSRRVREAGRRAPAR